MNLSNLLKRIELSIRRLFISSVEKPFNGVLVEKPESILTTPNPKILFLRQDRIGDVLVSTGLIKAVRDKYPNARIDIVLSTNNVAVQSAVSSMTDTQWIYQKSLSGLVSLILKLRSIKYDVVIDLMDNPSSTSTLLIQWCKANNSIGILKANATVYTHCVPLLDRANVHIIERIAQLLLPLGINPQEVELRPFYQIESITKPTDNSAKKLILNINGSRDNVWWGTDRFIQLIKYVQDDYPSFEIVVCSSKAYNKERLEIAVATGVHTIEPTDSFHEYVTILATSDILITPDTSIVHIASAFNIPCLAFYLQTDFGLLPWYPFKTPYRALVAKPDEHTIKIFTATQAYGLLKELIQETMEFDT
jgi:ADP-heptose:LPS heptosyltransferase